MAYLYYNYRVVYIDLTPHLWGIEERLKVIYAKFIYNHFLVIVVIEKMQEKASQRNYERGIRV